MSVIGSNILAGASGQAGYNLTKSLRFRSSASAYLNRTPASATNRTTWTWSGWVKRGNVSDSATVTLFSAGTFNNDDTVFRFDGNYIDFFNRNSSTTNGRITTNAVYRDPSAWYHVVIAWDTTQTTSSNRIKLYVNGTQVTSLQTATYPSQNQTSNINNNVAQYLGVNAGATSQYFDGYLTEVNFIDGQALTPSSFGETSTTTGVWIPKKYTGTYGTNGFYLPFTDTTSTSTLGTDFSGNSNTWTVNNISLTTGSTYDSMNDVPTLTSATQANYAVMNPLALGSSVTLSNGNLTMTEVGSYATTVSTMAMTSGKWYAEMTVGSDTYAGTVGIAKLGYSPTSRLGFQANTWSYNNDGGLYYNSSTLAAVSSYTTGDVIGIAFDATNLTIDFYKNNTLQSTQYTSANSGLSAGEFYFATGHINSTSNWNFGQRPFSYTPPTGFVALNTFNLPTPTIGATASTLAGKYFNPVLYTGNGGSQSVTGVGFQPDWVWVKVRSSTQNHSSNDSVRGAGNYLVQNATAAERFQGEFDSFDSDGFSLTYDGAEGDYNGSGKTYVAWNWRASNATAVSNTDGSITSQVSANTTAGFSVVTYTGTGANATVGHGLGAVPAMIMIKNRDSGAIGGAVYHTSIGATKYLKLFQTTTGSDQEATDNTAWNGSSPTFDTNVFSVGSLNRTNSAQQMVAYCFAPVAGYSAFGSYTGNNSTNGPFVFTGFRPRYIMIKSTVETSNWFVYDTARSPYNTMNTLLFPSDPQGDYTDSTYAIDAVSNGFKIRGLGQYGGYNNSGNGYIYMAFAENPFKYANAR